MRSAASRVASRSPSLVVPACSFDLAQLLLQRRVAQSSRRRRARGTLGDRTRRSRRSWTGYLLPPKIQKLMPTLCERSFIDRGDNVLAFGLPGRGKTHLVCAIGHELVRRGRRVWFTPTFALVQRLLAAKRDLRLEKELDALDIFDAVILDDIGYVQQNRDEMKGALHVPRAALRAQERHHHQQPRLPRMGSDPTKRHPRAEPPAVAQFLA